MQIKVDTDLLLEAAKRFEMLSLELADAGYEINNSLNALTSAMPGEDFTLEQISSLIRRSDLIKDELGDTRVKLRFAARRYEEADRQIHRMMREFIRSLNSGEEV